MHGLYNRGMTKSASRLKAFLVFSLFMTAIAGWHAMNDRPSSMDETKHMQLAMDYHDLVRAP